MHSAAATLRYPAATQLFPSEMQQAMVDGFVGGSAYMPQELQL